MNYQSQPPASVCPRSSGSWADRSIPIQACACTGKALSQSEPWSDTGDLPRKWPARFKPKSVRTCPLSVRVKYVVEICACASREPQELIDQIPLACAHPVGGENRQDGPKIRTGIALRFGGRRLSVVVIRCSSLGSSRPGSSAPSGSGLENQRRRLRALSDRLSGPGADRTEDSAPGVRDCEGAPPAMGRQATLKQPYRSRCGDSSIAADSREAKWQRGLCCPPVVGGSIVERGKSGVGADTTGWPSVQPGPPARRVDGSKPDNCVATRRAEAVRRLIGVGRRSLIRVLGCYAFGSHDRILVRPIRLYSFSSRFGSSTRWAPAPSAKSALVASLPRQRGRGRSR